MRIQEPPFTVKLELTEGCNLYCEFCGLRGIRAKPGTDYKFLTLETANRLGWMLYNSSWNPRIEMAMHGEPTQNPLRAEIVRVLRSWLPRTQLMMTSNGGGLLKGDANANIQELFDAGLNVLALDDYKYVSIVHKILTQWKGKVYRYPDDPDASPYKRRSIEEHMLIIMPDISDTHDGVHAADALSNHCGAAGPKNDRKEGIRCARPFREFTISYDGEVILCCNDWRREMPIMNLHETDHLEDIWQHVALNAIRKKLYHGERDIGPCDGCDSKSHRCGLLPDPKGTESLGMADDNDYQAIKAALSRGPLTTPVKRPWES